MRAAWLVGVLVAGAASGGAASDETVRARLRRRAGGRRTRRVGLDDTRNASDGLGSRQAHWTVNYRRLLKL